jgi:hypothetical protein
MNVITLHQKLLEEINSNTDDAVVQVEFQGPDRRSVYNIHEVVGLRYTPRGVAVVTLVVRPADRVDRWREGRA